MKSLTVVLIFATVCGAKGQSLDALCPKAGHDIWMCTITFVTEMPSSFIQMFRHTSEILSTVDFLEDASFPMICGPYSRIEVKKYYRCFTGELYSCLPDGWQQAFPASKSLEDSIDYLCDNLQDPDAKCLTDTSKLQMLDECIRNTTTVKTDELPSADDFIELKCSEYPMIESCMRAVYTTCPGNTTDVLIKYNQFMRPQGCAGCIFRSSLMLFLISLFSTFVFQKLECGSHYTSTSN